MRAALRSFLLPGWGQHSQGRFAAATRFLQIVILLTAIVIPVLLIGPGELASLFVRPWFLLLLIVVNLGVMVFRTWAVWDAWRAGARVILTPGIVVLVLVAVAPHALGTYYLGQTYSLINSVFDNPIAAGTTLPPAATTTPTQVSGIQVTTSSTSSTTSTTTTTIPWADKEQLNVLLLGGDAGPGRRGLRTDTMIVASINIATGNAALFGLPRNLGNLRWPNGDRFTAYQGILNEVYTYGIDHPDRFEGKNPGASAITLMAEGLTGIDIDYYMAVNLEAFVRIVDAFDGIDLYVPKRLHDPSYPTVDNKQIEIDIPKGWNHLDGATALAYVRTRADASDYTRMARQRCFLASLVGQADVPSLLTALPALVQTVKENVETDIPLEALPNLVELAGKTRAAEVIVVGFGHDWAKGFTKRGFPIPNVPKIHQAVATAIAELAGETDVEGLNLADAGKACGLDEAAEAEAEDVEAPDDGA